MGKKWRKKFDIVGQAPVEVSIAITKRYPKISVPDNLENRQVRHFIEMTKPMGIVRPMQGKTVH